MFDLLVALVLLLPVFLVACACVVLAVRRARELGRAIRPWEMRAEMWRGESAGW